MGDELIRAMKELRTDKEIAEYMGKMIWDFYMKDPPVKIHTINFDDVRVAISEASKTLISEDYQLTRASNTDYPIIYPARVIRDIWILQLYDAVENTVLRKEEYEVSEGVCQLQYWEESRIGEHFSCDIKEMTIFTGDKIGDSGYKDAEIVICLNRAKRRPGPNVAVIQTILIEYKNYYEERQEILGETKTTRIIWKHDLFRHELHTIPLKEIHAEMLYSLDTPIWYQNVARQTQKHFESLK